MTCPIYSLFKRAGRPDLVGVLHVTIPMRHGDIPVRVDHRPLEVDLPPWFKKSARNG